ncbi:hypothetical protein OOZ35_14135 [Mesoflavibacter profundi]|uniref:Uncharacterized protein n=1 Tax=Mesoflavibacter profundi TaxID=2708110 RepID=A0ABT4S3I8_9FLAO|nr:hypothetical protein [Mesoflavibacter profundi]MDA0175887.1 hypothetical protein [Mesoflavibacter profundi]MDA0178638.1 hypothetical protein [Mesoflavibacter profundi]
MILRYNYTGPEALSLVNQTYQDEAINQLHTASFKIVHQAITDQTDVSTATYTVIEKSTKANAIILIAALYRIKKDPTQTLESLYKIKYYEHQQKQIGNQLFFLERNESITGKQELRGIYQQQQQHIQQKINQLLNAFSIAEPAIINSRLNRR